MGSAAQAIPLLTAGDAYVVPGGARAPSQQRQRPGPPGARRGDLL